jgi:hypothetical protein
VCVGRETDARDSELQLLARYGQNDCVMVIGRRNWILSDAIAEEVTEFLVLPKRVVDGFAKGTLRQENHGVICPLALDQSTFGRRCRRSTGRPRCCQYKATAEVDPLLPDAGDSYVAVKSVKRDSKPHDTTSVRSFHAH